MPQASPHPWLWTFCLIWLIVITFYTKYSTPQTPPLSPSRSASQNLPLMIIQW